MECMTSNKSINYQLSDPVKISNNSPSNCIIAGIEHNLNILSMPTLSYTKLVFQLEERYLPLHLVPCQFFTHVKALQWGITKIGICPKQTPHSGNAHLGPLPATEFPPLFPCDRWVF